MNVITIAPKEKLGGILQFDPESTKQDLELGYYDGLRMLYGLAGERYYIDRQWSEMQAYFALNSIVERMTGAELSLRDMNEKILPRFARKLKVKEGSYHEILCACLEKQADQMEIKPFKVRTEAEFLQEIIESQKKN